MRDASVRRTLRLKHQKTAHPWTLEEPAQQAGLSRTALADSDRHLEAVASEVGDQDTFSFSKVFKRTVGVSPKAFRHRNAAERSHPWRLAG